MIISLLGGLAMFLYGMEIMGDGLKQGSGPALKNFLGKLTHNVVLGLLTGTIVTSSTVGNELFIANDMNPPKTHKALNAVNKTTIHYCWVINYLPKGYLSVRSSRLNTSNPTE